MTEPTIVIPVDEVLKRFDHGDRWIQGHWSNDQGECLHNGIRACQVQPGDAFIVEQVANQQGWGTSWNDEPGRTFDDIKTTLVQHREVFPRELEETFGPQWELIVALVRRAAVLTTDEVQGLAAAGDAAGDAARAAAWDAARAAARDAAWDAARAAAWDAAWAAARALVVRDLIGQHGFTQTHYDTLVAPWETVIGPIGWTGGHHR